MISKQAIAIGELQSFVTAYLAVLEAVAAGRPKPWGADPVLNAYDLRPRAVDCEPRPRRVSAALKELGYLNMPPAIDRGLFNIAAIERLQNTIKPRQGILELTQLVVAHHTYKKLADGRITRWKLIRG